MTQVSSKNTYLIQLDTLSTRLDHQGGPGYIWQLLPSDILQLCTRKKTNVDRQPVIIKNFTNMGDESSKFKCIDSEFDYELLIAIPHKNRLIVFKDPEWMKEGAIDVGVEVNVFHAQNQYSGIIRCRVRVKNSNGYLFGIELDEEFNGKGTSSGSFQGTEYFECPEECGMFVPLHKLRLKPAQFQFTGFGDKVKSAEPRESMTEGDEEMMRSESEVYSGHSVTLHAALESPDEISPGERIVWLTDEHSEYCGISQYGTVKWVGILPGSSEKSAGVEFDNPIGKGTGSYRSEKLFTAKPKHASFVPLIGLLRAVDFEGPSEGTNLKIMSHFSTDEASRSISLRSGSASDVDYDIIDTDKRASTSFASKDGTLSSARRSEMNRQLSTPSAPVKGHVMPPVLITGDAVDSICGLGKGIQGTAQSTGSLESILFAMFALYDMYDSYVFPDGKDHDAKLGEIRQLRRTLVEHVINPLRERSFVSWHKVKQFRDACNYVLSSCNLITANPSEVFCHIVGNIVRMEPLFTLSNEEPYNVYEIPQVHSLMSPPNIQHLLDCASLVSNHRIRSAPESILVLDFCSLSGNVVVFPSDEIDVSDLVENFPRECKICGVMAEVECADCFAMMDTDEMTKLSDITFCRGCHEQYHQNPNRKSHRSIRELNRTAMTAGNPSRVIMELFAVVSSDEQRNFTSFVKVDRDADGVWLMHDASAGKTEDGSGIPEIRRCDEMEKCFSVVSSADIGGLPAVVRQIIMGMRLCFYRRHGHIERTD